MKYYDTQVWNVLQLEPFLIKNICVINFVEVNSAPVGVLMENGVHKEFKSSSDMHVFGCGKMYIFLINPQKLVVNDCS